MCHMQRSTCTGFGAILHTSRGRVPNFKAQCSVEMFGTDVALGVLVSQQDAGEHPVDSQGDTKWDFQSEAAAKVL